MRALQTTLPLRTFVETGTFKGDTLASMLPFFDKLLSVELSKPMWTSAAARFEDEAKVEVTLADSPEFLASLWPSLRGSSTLFWLDAHWCASTDTAGETSQCPLLAELRAIKTLSDDSAVLIDDARLFLAPPAAPHEVSQWPRFHDIVVALLSLSASHELMVVNDVIAFFPSSARRSMDEFAKTFGVDWIEAGGRVHDVAELSRALVEKEQLIQKSSQDLVEKEGELQLMSRSLIEKERVISQLVGRLGKFSWFIAGARQ